MTTARVQLQIEGLTCAHCAKGVEDHLKEIGLADARVDFSSNSVSFSEQPKIIVTDILDSLNKIGFKARLQGQGSQTKSRLNSIGNLTLFCSLFSAPLVFAEILHIKALHDPIVQLCLTLPVMLSGGLYFLKSAVRSLRIKKPNMDVLIALGTWAAFIYSLAGTIFQLGPEFLFYESSASIIAIVLIGNFIEARAVAKTEASLSSLQKLTPDVIRVKDPLSGQIKSIRLDLVKVGDQIVLSPGDRVPSDGEVIEGAAELDESFLSGESIPRSVTLNNSVHSGALVLGGNIVIKATAVGDESSLVKIIRTINEARTAKPNLERLADQITNYFVPVVLIIAILAFLINLLAGVSAAQSLLRSIAILVISCPCALGLATPTAVTVALGLSSRLGILVRKASIFEALPKVTHFFFDKTGTLTDGKFKVEKLDCNANKQVHVKQVILGLEALSHHPIAVALREYCSIDNSLQASTFAHVDEQRGLGVFGKDKSGHEYELSSREVQAPFHLALRENGQIIAQIQLSDSLRIEAPATIKWLKERKNHIEILSGDSSERTTQIAGMLGITDFKSRLLPQSKLDIVAQKEARVRVAFVGDGINDGAALARANVGITFGSASDLARHSADVTIVSGGLEKIAYLLQLSEKTTSSIKQNLFWAFIYNIIFIPFAAFGFLSPMHAAFAMVLSDVIVVANSLRLKLWQPKVI